MTPEEIVAEMQRKPDAQTLVEWIRFEADTIGEARSAIDAYFEGVDR